MKIKDNYEIMKKRATKSKFSRNKRRVLFIFIIIIVIVILYVNYEIEDTNTEEKIYKNVWIIEAKDKNIEVFINDSVRNYTTVANITENICNMIGDIKVKNGKVSDIVIKPSTIEGKVISADNTYIEIENYGKVEYDKNCAVYCLNGENIIKDTLETINIGNSSCTYVIEGEKICAILNREFVPDRNIRVILKNSDYSSIFHKEVKIKCSKDMRIYCENESSSGNVVKSVKANEEINVSDIKYNDNERIIFKTDGGKFSVSTISRSVEGIIYGGTIEVMKNDEGYVIINDISIEEYLYGVVPSEMPQSFGLEALKAQAVCARTYAYNNLSNSVYKEYGANVDDSTSYQVYNNQLSNDLTKKAVDETKGVIMKEGEKYVNVYYFSTSCGYVSSAKEVFASTSSDYIKGGYQSVKENSNNQEFETFIKTSNTNCFENDCAWFRWKAIIEKEAFGKSVNAAINKLFAQNNDNIEVIDSSKKKVSSVGEIKQISVISRESTGLVTEIEIKGTIEKVKVKTQNAVRTVLSPISGKVEKKDGTIVSNMSMLPSSYFTIEYNEGNYIIYGGGYGHGAGMSQWGAKKLAENGYDYVQILNHYYTGVDIGTK